MLPYWGKRTICKSFIFKMPSFLLFFLGLLVCKMVNNFKKKVGLAGGTITKLYTDVLKTFANRWQVCKQTFKNNSCKTWHSFNWNEVYKKSHLSREPIYFHPSSQLLPILLFVVHCLWMTFNANITTDTLPSFEPNFQILAFVTLPLGATLRGATVVFAPQWFTSDLQSDGE